MISDEMRFALAFLGIGIIITLIFPNSNNLVGSACIGAGVYSGGLKVYLNYMEGKNEKK